MSDEDNFFELDKDQYERLKASVAENKWCKSWNDWRDRHPEIDISLSRANLQKADLGGANLKGAQLDGANLKGADLGGAELQGAKLWEAKLQGADLWGAKLQKANLWEANLQEADLGEANLQEAYLSGANLQEADLFGANLQDAYLTAADLQGATFDESTLYGADLTYANLTGADLLGIKYTKALRLPYSAKCMLLRFLTLWHTRKFLRSVMFIALLLFILIMPYCIGFVLKRLWICPLWYLFFLAFWPIIAMVYLLIDKGLFPLDKAIKAVPDYVPKLSPLITRIISPTTWRGVVADNVRRCNPVDLRYIKDQSYLEEKIESAKGWWSRLWMFLWGITSGYGDNIWLWILWSLFLAFSFGATFALLGPDAFMWREQFDADGILIRSTPQHWYAYIYYSVVTFTTLGFGDITPATGGAMVVLTLEVTLGYVMLGGLISIFATKLARRA